MEIKDIKKFSKSLTIKEVENKASMSYYYYCTSTGASLVTQMVKKMPAMQKTQVRCLGWDDTLEK